MGSDAVAHLEGNLLGCAEEAVRVRGGEAHSGIREIEHQKEPVSQRNLGPVKDCAGQRENLRAPATRCREGATRLSPFPVSRQSADRAGKALAKLYIEYMLKAGVTIRKEVIELFEARVWNAPGNLLHMHVAEAKFPVAILWPVVTDDGHSPIGAHA